MAVNAKHSNDDLPADEGHQAFRNRETPDDNPYQEGDLRFSEWQFGCDVEEQSNPDSVQIVYWFLASMSVIPFARGWAGLSGIYKDMNVREAWWSIGRFTGRK